MIDSRMPTEERARKQYPTKYLLDENGDIQKLEITGTTKNGLFRIDQKSVNNYKKHSKEYNLKDFESAVAAQKKFTYENTQSSISKLKSDYEGQLAQNTTYNTLIDQIAGLTRGAGQNQPPGGPASIGQLNAFGGSSLQNKLNFQVSDDDIISDYNKTKQDRLSRVVSDGNIQIAGINTRLDAAQSLYDKLPDGDARKTSAKVMLDNLKSDLASVQTAVSKATDQISNYTPITSRDDEGLKQITSFREYARLPEERASDQLRQIDPKAYETAVGLGQQYRDMATQPIGETKTAQTEQLRNTIEQEAINQLRLGASLGAEERRSYEQAIRSAQSARGNLAGIGPAVQEAAQLGAAGEARKLARYNAAQQFLGSGETTGAAAARDLLLREGIQQNRLGAAAGFIANGPSMYNLANQRLGQQNAMYQGYVQANQSMPGSFQTQGAPANFYQTTNPEIPVQLSGQAGSIYNTMQNAQASMYGSQVDALSRVAVANSTPNYINAVGSLFGTGGVFCWVAREVYGEDNPKWLQFREWMLTKASDNLRNFYTEYGERIAESIRNKPKIKSIIRKWMDSKIG